MAGDIVRLRDLARGVVRRLPDAFSIPKAALSLLVLLRPESRNSIGAFLEKQAKRYGDRPALVFENRQWTYVEFNAWANRFAAMLRKQGVKPGDAVGVLFENRPELLACVAGIVKLGAVAGMLNPNQRGDVLAHSIALIKAKLIVAGEECRETLETTPYAPNGKQALQCIWGGEGAAPGGYLSLKAQLRGKSSANPPETAAIVLKSPAFYIFTSGTTGLPKASVMTHYRWMRGNAGLAQIALGLKDEDRFYCCLPLYHNNALTVSWGAAVGSGAALILARKFSASKFWDDIRRHDVTAFCYIGELCRYLLNRPLSREDKNHRVRLIVGNGLRPEIWDAFVARFGIESVFEFYAASESNVAFVNGFGLSKTAGFCPMSYAVVKFDAEAEQPIRDRKRFMQKVDKGSVGLLITEVTDRAPFDGYTDKRASEKKLFRDVFQKGDCWFNTGDLVRDQGLRHIQFVDRVGDTFRWKGENVATTEVESALNRHPQVEQAVVYGVQVAGTDGRAGMAALTWNGQSFDGAGLARHLGEALPPYAVPLFVRLRDEQELTGTFKFRKVDLKKQGFDPALVGEPLYVLLDRRYEPLTPEVFGRIARGELRL
jgi:acyl-CoA synthetase (AMP-forming)/AMP-acid ligase II